MANYRRRRPRTTSTHGRWNRRREYQFVRQWLNSWPRWHDLVFHTRPHRRRTREAIVSLMQGRDPDVIAWPVAKKPHVYYW